MVRKTAVACLYSALNFSKVKWSSSNLSISFAVVCGINRQITALFEQIKSFALICSGEKRSSAEKNITFGFSAPDWHKDSLLAIAF